MIGKLETVIVVVCPGQGSQRPGFLTPWLAEPQYLDHLAALSESAGVDLVAHGTTSDADTIRDTAIAQPLIVAAGILTFAALTAGGRRNGISGIAGHSVGEITAAAGAGVLTDADAMEFVRERGDAMARAAAEKHTGMSAVIGADETELRNQLDALGLFVAHVNSSGQIVAAGAVEALATLAENPPARARVIPLEVAGAFHTSYMNSAVPHLTEVASHLTPQNPTLALWTNHDGSRITDGAEFVRLLVHQVSSPARWDLDMKSFAEAGITGMIELCPGGTLVGLAKRELKGIPTVALKTPEDLPAAYELIDTAA